MRGFLEIMRARRLDEVAGLDTDALESAASEIARDPRDLHDSLTLSKGVSIIAEVKKASPSAGPIAPDVDPGRQAVAYERGGASAVSVLVEPTVFDGSFKDVASVSAVVGSPVLCKDFVVHRNQLLLARASGADAVLLMVSLLGSETPAYVTAAHGLGLKALVEVHDETEYAVAVRSGVRVVGVNARDLRDLTVDTEGALTLISHIATDGLCVVAESGVRSAHDVLRAGEAGASAVLVGEMLMRADDPEQAVRRLAGVWANRVRALRR